ncbi:porin [Acinetobacter sp. NCu2D-2]|uniref:OprD family outer membrane porin n=1 Tax=Acinetobacter sp. NCu2D-2 TaxID=1608473 RepID=UPI0007CDCD46|nr:OprD family outer membrane porin [Acinetobacter sp. NCu2D-2]ANF81262.1 porin [Acinetobacter sp. NCu2D-2]
MNKPTKLSVLIALLMPFSPEILANNIIEDGTFDVMNRNFYFYRDFREGAYNTAGANTQVPVSEKEGYRSEWAQGIVAEFKSGFTDTPVQFGFNFHAMGALKLYSNPYKTGTNILEFDGATGETKETNGEFGGALKFKYKDTTVTYGDQFPNTPVIAVSTVRLLPSTATGISVQDKSFDNLTINAAHFYRMNPVDTTESLNYFTTDYAAGITSNSISFVGGTYKHKDVLYTAYASELEDVWNQYYLGASTSYKLAQEGHALRFATSNYYNTDTGAKNGGDISALALSGLLGYQIGKQTFSIGYQQIIGDEPFDWVAFKTLGANTSILNAAQYATFSEANEKSVQLKYEADLSEFGLNGFSFMGRYLYGWDIDNSDSKNLVYNRNGAHVYNKDIDYTHWERDLTLGYKVQTGFAKGLDIKLRQATHRATKGYRYNDIDELRVILEYPLSF